MPTNPVVIIGDATNVFSDARGFVSGIQNGINAVNAGDLAGGMAALSAILATHSSVFAQLAPVASGLTIAADLAKLQDAIATNNFDQGVDAALGLIGGVGGLLALSPLPQTKALGIAISALANASKEIYKNREDIAGALSDINRALSTDPYSPVTILDPQSLIDNGLLDPNTLLPRVDPERFNPEDYPDLKYKQVWGPDPAASDGYRSAKTPPPRDPLAIDLDADGIETLGIPTDGSSPVLFDHNANGIKTGTGWLTGDDAWLVRDLDGNGSIDSGRELFGVDTVITATGYYSNGTPYTYTRRATSGFEALRTLDENGDSVFNASDSAFTQVKLWQDLNRDGISQASELFTLADKGIASISLNETTATTNLGNGNSITGTAVVTRSNGSTTAIDSADLTAGNLNLADNPFYREFTDEIPLTEAALALPEMGASGWIRDMQSKLTKCGPGNCIRRQPRLL
ncbi:hypothetical protein [Caldimonas sp. KR1-144]|uniref:hypothetical protein n=1 Tax=Caldimonas sp. KR1-144 TaxID=3400911 RepID=UPI003BFF2189